MNESQSTSELPQQAAHVINSSATVRDEPLISHGYARGQNKGASKRPWLVYFLLLLLTVLLFTLWWSVRNDNMRLREEIARRLQVGDGINTETKVIVKSVQEGIKELQAKVSVLDNKQLEAQSQQLALEQLYKDLSKNGDDWALSEVEDVLSTASQQLQLAGNVQGALIALQNADKSLSRSDKPQFTVIRQAIAHDIDKLKVLPALDVTGIAVRLDSVISQVDSMPLLADEKPVFLASQPHNQIIGKRALAHDAKLQQGSHLSASQVGQDDIVGNWKNAFKDKWQSWSMEMWREISHLIRVRSVATPDALLLSPTQAYYARENLKLRLLNARLGLLSRNENAFRSDLITAQETITKYFDTRAKQTQTAQTLLKQVQGSDLSITMPALDSVNVIRTYKGKP